MQLDTPDTRRRVVFNPADRDWTALYDERPIGVFPRPSLARQALDAYVYELTRRGQLPPEPPLDDPLTLYTAGGPDAAIPVIGEQLDAALAHFCANTDQPKVLERARRAHDLLANHERWAILPGGVVQIVGKGATYLVTDEACRTLAGEDCPDQKYRTGVTGGQCYHTIARELLRLAQALGRQADAPPLAFVRLSGRLLSLAIAIVYLAEEPVRWHLDNGRLTLSAQADPPTHEVCLACCDGAGAAAITVAPDDVATLWATLKPVAPRLESIQVFIDPSAGQLALCADGLSAIAPGRAAV